MRLVNVRIDSRRRNLESSIPFRPSMAHDGIIVREWIRETLVIEVAQI
jgi:hypothetical protein